MKCERLLYIYSWVRSELALSGLCLLTCERQAYSILFDAIFTLIPLGIIYRSKLQVRDKIMMCALAGMGCL
jgi:hypothetical protein